jgi:hypothetical protein
MVLQWQRPLTGTVPVLTAAANPFRFCRRNRTHLQAFAIETRMSLCSHSPREPPMGLFTRDIKTMDDLLLHGLKDIYYAENQIVKSLPALIDKATNRELSKGLSDHLEETRKQITRLDQVFKKLGQPAQGVQCPAIEGLIKEADEVAGEVADKEVLDAAIVGGGRSIGRALRDRALRHINRLGGRAWA